jgi:hypothetical protein
MNKTTTNIIVLLGIVIVMFGSYFFFTQDSQMFLESSTSDQQLERLFVSSQLFIERSRTLSDITLDTKVFESEVFNSLKSYSPPPEEFTPGRPNPFAAVNGTGSINSESNQ